MLSETTSFSTARRHLRPLMATAVLLLSFGLLAFLVGRSGVILPFKVHVPRAIGYAGIALWLAGAGCLSAGVMTIGRLRLMTEETAPPVPPAPLPLMSVETLPDEGHWRGLVRRELERLRSLRPPPLKGEALTGGLQALAAGLGGLLALAALLTLWRLPPETGLTVLLLRVYGAMLVACVFPLLVLERSFANISAGQLPEAPQINRLLRVPLAVLLLLGSLMILSSAGFAWAVNAQVIAPVLILVVAAELVLRCMALMFVPFAAVDVRRGAADSRIAGAVLRLQWPSIKTVNSAVRRQFGVDLSRSWALAFVRKALMPVVFGTVMLAWLVSGVTALGVNQRGVYERFGAPVAVFGSGVHAHLPWPFGVIRPVENGVVHQLPIEFLLPNGDKGEVAKPEAQPKLVGAEAHPSDDSDRLWTGDHPFEGSYLIASDEDGRQSFQLVDTDMAVIYRVGSSDEAARDAAYRLADPDELIQALSGQLLVRYFVQHRLLDVLGESRESFARDFQRQLQKQLDALSSGLEVLSVSIEAIHPPPGAAAAYHDVQAAEIRATSSVFTSQAGAVASMTSAQQTAVRTRNEAIAVGAESVTQARSDAVIFGGDKTAYALGGPAFLFERRLAAVSKALVKTPSAIIVDHRIKPSQMPTLDLRPAGSAGGIVDASPPSASAQASPRGAVEPATPPQEDPD